LADVWSLRQGDDPVIGPHGPDPSCDVGQRVQKSLLVVDRLVADAVVAELGPVARDGCGGE
jgi:hypothetical protein